MVEMVLTARDHAGQTGDSKPLRFKLPERSFEKPLAKALIEQRRALVLDPERREDVVRLLDALSFWPEGILEESSIYLGVRVARTSLYHARSHDDVKSTIALLWDLAVAIEDGDVPEAKRALDEARKALQQALAEGAPPEKIAELMSRLREAMERYLAAMAQQAQRNAQAKDGDSRRDPNGRTIKPEDLNRMLDAIDKLARSGANEAAQELLSRLEEILSNLQPSLAEQGLEQQMPPLADMLQDLGDLLQRQQELMDQTYRLPRNGEEGEMSGQEGNEPGMRGQRPGEPNALARQQDELGKLLEQLMAELGKNGLQAPEGLGQGATGHGRCRRAPCARPRGEERSANRATPWTDCAREPKRWPASSCSRAWAARATTAATARHAAMIAIPWAGRCRRAAMTTARNATCCPMRRPSSGRARFWSILRGRANDATRPRLERDYLDRLLRGLY